MDAAGVVRCGSLAFFSIGCVERLFLHVQCGLQRVRCGFLGKLIRYTTCALRLHCRRAVRLQTRFIFRGPHASFPPPWGLGSLHPCYVGLGSTRALVDDVI